MLDYPGRAQSRLTEYVQPFGEQGESGIAPARFLAIHDRTQTPPAAARIGRWRTEMTPTDRHNYEEISGP